MDHITTTTTLMARIRPSMDVRPTFADRRRKHTLLYDTRTTHSWSVLVHSYFTFTLLIWRMVHWRDSAGNAIAENSNVFWLIRMHSLPSARACSSKTVLQRNPPDLNWGCRLMLVVLYNGRKTVLVVIVY